MREGRTEMEDEKGWNPAERGRERREEQKLDARDLLNRNADVPPTPAARLPLPSVCLKADVIQVPSVGGPLRTERNLRN